MRFSEMVVELLLQIALAAAKLAGQVFLRECLAVDGFLGFQVNGDQMRVQTGWDALGYVANAAANLK